MPIICKKSVDLQAYHCGTIGKANPEKYPEHKRLEMEKYAVLFMNNLEKTKYY